MVVQCSVLSPYRKKVLGSDPTAGCLVHVWTFSRSPCLQGFCLGTWAFTLECDSEWLILYLYVGPVIHWQTT